jgi:hypothetical protein
MELALWGIKLSQGPASLRQWWADERARREEYGLSQDQTDLLIEACREQVLVMEREARPTPKPKPRLSNTKSRQASMI